MVPAAARLRLERDEMKSVQDPGLAFWMILILSLTKRPFREYVSCCSRLLNQIQEDLCWFKSVSTSVSWLCSG